MLLFNITLIVHFICFVAYLFILGRLWSTYNTQIRDLKGLLLGITLFISGIVLVVLKYPNVNYYKVVPKTSMFLFVTIINIKFGNKPYTKQAYYALIGLTVAAACLAVVRM